MAVAAGMASTILLTYGTNARSGKFDFGQPIYGGDMASAAGLVHIAGRAGLALQRHKYLYGTTDRQFGMLAVGQRQWAQRNPKRDLPQAADHGRLPGGAVHGRAASPVGRHDDLRRGE